MDIGTNHCVIPKEHKWRCESQGKNNKKARERAREERERKKKTTCIFFFLTPHQKVKT